jgi:hypothetical protein
MRLDSSGNFGIGTASPSSYGGAVKLAVASSSNASLTIASGTSSDGTLLFADGTSGDATYRGQVKYSHSSDAMLFNTAATERLRIDSSGNVGIGTTSPYSTSGYNSLTLNGSTGSQMRFRNNDVDRGLIFNNSTSFNIYSMAGIPLVFFASAHERMRIDSSGRLLVGASSARTSWNNTTIGANILQVERAGSALATALSITANSGTSNSTNPVSAAARLLLGRGRGTVLGSNTIVASGDILGDVSFQGNDGAGFVEAASIQAFVDGNPGSNDMPAKLIFKTTADGAASSTERFKIAQNGHIRCLGFYSNTTASGANMHVESDGDVKRSTSSKKYKTAIEDIENTYSDALLDCRPVWYRSTCTGDNSSHGFWGFIAEEVAEIDPRLVLWKTNEVTYDEEGSAVSTPCDPEPEGVVYDRFVPHLLNLIKRQQAAIETLETKVAALEAG